jgi:hypothetical protein
MSKSFGEDFRQPTDFYTGQPIPGAPLVGRPSTSRPQGNGYVQIMPQDGDMTATPTNPKKATLASMMDQED